MQKSWNKIELNPRTLEDQTINKIQENIQYLYEKIKKEYDIEELESVEASKRTPISQIGNILRGIEKNLDIINSTPYESRYYVEPNEIYRKFDRKDYQRWILILNDIYDIIVNGKLKYVNLIEHDGFNLIDKNGFNLIARG